MGGGPSTKAWWHGRVGYVEHVGGTAGIDVEPTPPFTPPTPNPPPPPTSPFIPPTPFIPPPPHGPVRVNRDPVVSEPPVLGGGYQRLGGVAPPVERGACDRLGLRRHQPSALLRLRLGGGGPVRHAALGGGAGARPGQQRDLVILIVIAHSAGINSSVAARP